MRIVHLAFEDHRRPGSGGGGYRTHQINRRLADRHCITVVTARYPGARCRIEDGIAYRPLGLNLGYFGSIVTYHLAVPWYVACHRADLVVEDFAAPISSALVPLFTRRPTVAVVQWLFARERSAHYHLPFYLFEELGVKLHRRFVVVSEHMASRIRAMNPDAIVDTVPGGVAAPDGRTSSGRAGSGITVLYLGRLEWEPKGLDLLIEAFARLRDLSSARLVVAGDGRSFGRVQAAAARAGIADRVEMAGRVSGDAKWSMLAEATVVAVPSRHETFGLVALEAAAVGTPVVAFDLPSFGEIFSDGGAELVECYDVAAFAGALRRLLTDPEYRASLAGRGPGRGSRFDWDQAARAHEQAYEAAVLAGR